jgi:two-component system catabolic regulation response regulator CreB
VANQKQILIVEDEPSIADTIVYALETEGFAPTRVATLAEARVALHKTCYSAIVLDVGLPDGNGFEFCKDLRKTSQTPVLFLTARNDEIDRIVGLEIGADDYVTKPFSPREVTARLKAIFRRVEAPAALGCELQQQGFQVDEGKRQIHFRGQQLELSRYEFGILSLLLTRPGQVYSRQQIMEKVWEEPDMSLKRTVDTHMKTLRGKLKAIAPDEDVLITHRGVGYSIKEIL